jgi:hypothetical protein
MQMQTGTLVFVTELAVPRLIGLVIRLDPTGWYQKSYPGSDGVTLKGILITLQKQKRVVSGNGKAIQRRTHDPYS